MADQEKDIQRLNPDTLVSGFRRLDIFVIGLVLAVAIHAVVLGVTSIGYIVGEFTPETDQAPAETPAETPAEQETPAEEAPAEEAPAEEAPAETETEDQDDAAGIPENLRDHPEMKAITEKADPEEIPEAPGTGGISIDEMQDE